MQQFRGKRISAAPGVAEARPNKVIRVGSDCTGLGTESVALQLAGIHVRCEFASESDPQVRTLFKALHGQHVKVEPDVAVNAGFRTAVDLYVAGPPCQSWSTAGSGLGLEDLRGRGITFYNCLEYVCTKRPRVAVIENVMGLYKCHVQELRDIMTILQGANYSATWECVRAQDNGLPQNRSRVYIVAIHNNSRVRDFTWPVQMRNRPPVNQFLEDLPRTKPYYFTCETARRNWQTAKEKLQKAGVNYKEKPCFVDVMASKAFAQVQIGKAPCITATRAAQGGYYITTKRRLTTLTELGRLQGWPTWKIATLLGTNVPPRIIGHAIGNGMSVNVLMRLLPRALWAAGLLESPAKDIWKKYTRNCPAEVMPDDWYRRCGHDSD